MIQSFCKIGMSLLLILCTIQMQAQYKLSGQLLSAENKTEMDSLDVHLIPLQEQLDTLKTKSDAKGEFLFEAAKGQHLLIVQEEEQLLHQLAINLQKDTTLGIISIDNFHSTTVAGAEVVAQKSSFKIVNGKFVYTPALLSAQSAFEVLQTTPGLRVADDIIEIFGKGVPRIMINGRWSRMDLPQIINYLKSLPAAQVKLIEIAKNPGAEQDAENRSGYINIVLKGRKSKGVDGSISGDLSKATYFSGNGAVNLNANFGKLQINANAGYGCGNNFTLGYNKLYFPDKFWSENQRQNKAYQSLPLSLSADYQIKEKHSIGAGLNYLASDWISTEFNPTLIYNLARTSVDSSLLTKGTNPEVLNNYAFNFNYIFEMDSTGKKLKFDLDHFKQAYNRNQDFTNFMYDAAHVQQGDRQRFKSGNDQNIYITTANIQMDMPTNWMHLSYGAKYSYISNRNKTSFYQYTQDNWVADPKRFDHFVYDETTYALFVKANKTVKKWNANAGLRFEHTQTLGISEVYNVRNENQYGKLFPSADLTYSQNENNIYSLSYSRRIDRPIFSQVNPFRWYHTQYAFTNGNPSLQPYFSHNVEWNYILKQKYFLNAYYSRSNNVFSEYDFADPATNMRETRVGNILNTDAWGISASAQLNFWKRWLFMPQINANYMQIISKVDFLNYSAGTYTYIGLFQQINLDKKKQWFVDLNSYYIGPRNFGIMQFKAMWGQSAKITFNSVNKKWQYVLFANDIFKTTALRYNSIINDVLRERYVYRDQRHIGFSVRYNFGYGQMKAPKQKTAANQDEMNRVGG